MLLSLYIDVVLRSHTTVLCRNITYDAAQYLELITLALADAGGYEVGIKHAGLGIERNLSQTALDDADHTFCIIECNLVAEPHPCARLA
uniref:Uncharacterized protein n=1 Tax=Candidatus Methanogaster sp. ANME-2c ERB4 TaxID=2759911 RepID=A0A7G9YRE1_9EURY|nr:hypothetical protein BMFBKKFN_00001 [Methanosarcinales archaeon ANME-2c ERB4]